MAALVRALTRRATVFAIALLGLSPVAARARTASVWIDLEADADAGCPPRRALMNRVAACASEPIGRWPWRAVSFQVRVRRAGPGLDARIRMRVGDREPRVRRLVGPVLCADVLAVAALNICIALDMVTDTELAAVPRRRGSLPSARHRRAEPQWRLPGEAATELGLSIYATTGTGPSPSAGLSLSALTGGGPVAGGAFVRIDAPASAPFQTGRIGASQVLAGPGVCALKHGLRACLIQHAGWKHFYFIGFTDSVREWHPQLLSSARVGWEVGERSGLHVSLWLQADISWFADLQSVIDRRVDPPRERSWRAPRLMWLAGLRLHRGG